MTKSEMDYLDTALLGPFLLFMNQYFNYVVEEKHLLYFSLVRVRLKYLALDNQEIFFDDFYNIGYYSAGRLWTYGGIAVKSVWKSVTS